MSGGDLILQVTAWIVLVLVLGIVLYVFWLAYRLEEGKRKQREQEHSPEVLAVLNGQCPACHDVNLHAGPQGGAATNFACFTCLARFNAVFIPGDVLCLQHTGHITEHEQVYFRQANLLQDLDYLYRG